MCDLYNLVRIYFFKSRTSKSLDFTCFSQPSLSKPCIARVSGVIVICSEITDCGKSEQD